MQIIRYTQDKNQEWDKFVEGSRNGTFLFLRRYMDYHSRFIGQESQFTIHGTFEDHSLMYYSDKGKLLTVMAANEQGGILYSHQGLTYGGFVVGNEIRSAESKELFDLTLEYLRSNGFSEWYYKPVPTIYHKCPTEEDEYWLWRNGATIVCCNLSCTVLLDRENVVPMERRRRRGIKKAESLGYHIIEKGSLDIFWPIMLNNLREKYDTAPVHTLEEMKLLHERLSEHIEVYLCNDDQEQSQAGAVIYLANSNVIHVQYAHATLQGKEDGAIDFLYAYLIKKYQGLGYKYFDIGTSNEDGGHYLNENLIAQKEGFGGRGIVYKQFKITI